MAERSASEPGGAAGLLKALFLRLGVLPFFLVAALVVFALVSAQFLSLQNLTNVARQSVYLVLVSLGQMLVLISGGFDLAVGTAIGRNPVSFVIPCHRVLGKSGSLCGYHWGLTRKRAILGWEAGLIGGE